MDVINRMRQACGYLICLGSTIAYIAYIIVEKYNKEGRSMGFFINFVTI